MLSAGVGGKFPGGPATEIKIVCIWWGLVYVMPRGKGWWVRGRQKAVHTDGGREGGWY